MSIKRIERGNHEIRLGTFAPPSEQDLALAQRVLRQERARTLARFTYGGDKSRVRCPECGLMTFRATRDTYGKHEAFGIRCQMSGKAVIS